MHTHTTRSELRAQLASRLGDPGLVHWVEAELDLIIDDGLRRWSLLTGTHRVVAAPFTPTAGTALYSIDSIAALSDYVGHSRTDRDEIGIIQYMLREPYDPIDGTGMSDQFTFASIVAALERARDRFLADTQSVLTIGTLAVPPGDTITLPDTFMAMRRAVWLDGEGFYTNLHPSDEHEVLSYDALYPLSPGIPELYSRVAAAQQELRLSPPAADNGTIHYVGVVSGAALDPSTPVGLGVPDDATWIVRALALADLLGRDGPAYDPSRAAACLREYQLGVALLASSTRILGVALDGRPVIPSGVADLDYEHARPHWQNTSGTPTDAGIISGDVLALRPVPDSNAHSVSLDLVRKAPLPADDGAFIQIGREDVNALLDGCESLALWKNGGVALDDADSLMGRMLGAASRYNSRLSALGYGSAQAGYDKQDESSRPTSGSGPGAGTIPGVQPGMQQQQRQQQPNNQRGGRQ